MIKRNRKQTPEDEVRLLDFWASGPTLTTIAIALQRIEAAVESRAHLVPRGEESAVCDGATTVITVRHTSDTSILFPVPRTDGPIIAIRYRLGLSSILAYRWP